MARYIVRVILFLLPLIAILVLADFWLARRPNTFVRKKTYMESAAARTQVVVTGTSHALYGINPEYLGAPAFNLAEASQDFYYDRAVLERFLPQMTRLKLALLTVSCFSFQYRLSDAPEYWRSDFYTKVYGIPKERKQSAFDFGHRSWLSLYGPRETLAGIIDRTPPPDMPGRNGWMVYENAPMGVVSDSKISAQKGADRVASHLALMHPPAEPFNMAQIEELCTRLQQQGVAIAIVIPPVYSTYYQALPSDVESQMLENIRRLTSRFHISCYNYMRDARFRRDDFHDNDHLARDGSRKFSTILKQEVVARYLPVE